MKIIFLDIDGVISTFEKAWRLDINKLELLSKIIEETGAKTVISSSWRVGCNTIEDMKNRLSSFRLDDSDEFQVFLNSIVGLTQSGSQNGVLRGNEIQDWIDNHDNIESYVILDDDSDMLEKQLFNFVQTDTYEGLTEREVKLCISVLNNEEVINPIRLNYTLRNNWLNNRSGLYNTDISERTMFDKLETIKENLFIDGGIAQAKSLISCLFDSTSNSNIIKTSDILRLIADIVENYEEIINERTFVPISRFMSGVEGNLYPVITKDFKFKLLTFGSQEFNDAEYVMPYFPSQKAKEILFNKINH